MPENHTRRPKSSTKHELVRQDIDEKWKRTMMTPTGIKIIRIQPSLNYDSLHKYQYRPYDVSSTSTKVSPVPPPSGSPGTARSNSRALSSTSMRSTPTQTSGPATARPGEVLERPPAPANRPGSSRSCHSATYNSRNRSCQPTHMYMKDDLRRAAKQNRPASHVHSCSSSQIDDYLTTKTPRSPRRFDGSVVTLPKFVEGNEFLTHQDLSMGQKQYIWGIARIYSMSNIMQLKQRQYQSLLDYDFNRRIQNKELKEHERMKEWREYIRYSKFIKNYEQRIPRAGKQTRTSTSPCEEVSHIHRHVIKGWTTNPQSDEAYRPAASRERLETRNKRDDEIEEVRRLPADQSEEEDESIQGHYKIVVVKTPKTEENTRDETNTKQESHDEQPTDVSDVQHSSNTAEQFSDGEDSNYL